MALKITERLRPLSWEAGSSNRFVQVLEQAALLKAGQHPWQRPLLADEFFRENPMPWLLDSDPIEEPEAKEQRRSA